MLKHWMAQIAEREINPHKLSDFESTCTYLFFQYIDLVRKKRIVSHLNMTIIYFWWCLSDIFIRNFTPVEWMNRALCRMCAYI